MIVPSAHLQQTESGSRKRSRPREQMGNSERHYHSFARLIRILFFTCATERLVLL